MYFVKVQVQTEAAADYEKDGELVIFAPRDGTRPTSRPLYYAKSADEVAERLGYSPVSDTSTSPTDQLLDEWLIDEGPLFRYHFVYETGLHVGVKNFVAAANDGSTPQSWTARKATTEAGTGPTHYVTSVEKSRSQAFALGAEQRAFSQLSDLPRVQWYQLVSPAYGRFSGATLRSRQPVDTGEDRTYGPGDLYQTSDSEWADRRGSVVDVSDLLERHSLTLI